MSNRSVMKIRLKSEQFILCSFPVPCTLGSSSKVICSVLEHSVVLHVGVNRQRCTRKFGHWRNQQKYYMVHITFIFKKQSIYAMQSKQKLSILYATMIAEQNFGKLKCETCLLKPLSSILEQYMYINNECLFKHSILYSKGKITKALVKYSKRCPHNTETSFNVIYTLYLTVLQYQQCLTIN